MSVVRGRLGNCTLFLSDVGVSAKNQEPTVARNVMFWRNLMEYMLIKHWQNCVDYLQEYDVVGELPSFLCSAPPQLFICR